MFQAETDTLNIVPKNVPSQVFHTGEKVALQPDDARWNLC